MILSILSSVCASLEDQEEDIIKETQDICFGITQLEMLIKVILHI